MSGPATGPRRFPFTGGDSFALGLDGLCHRGWGGSFCANTELEIEGTPDRSRLTWLAAELPRRLPFLRAVLHRGLLLQAPHWEVPAEANGDIAPLPLQFHRCADIAGDDPVIASVHDLRTRLLSTPLHRGGRPPHMRLDVVRHHPTRWLLIITWSHLLLDGSGIEHFVSAMAQMWDDPQSAFPLQSPTNPEGSAWQRFQDCPPMGRYLAALCARRFPSASRGRLIAQPPRHLVDHLTEDETRRSAEVLKKVGGDLMAVFFYAVIAARAHRAVLHARGIRGASLVLGVPAQLRPKTAAGAPAIFQNHMTILYYALDDAELDDLSSACRLVMRQNVDHLRQKRHLSFTSLLSLARHIPSRPFLRLIRWQQHGELVSLFHSWTGTFAPGLTTAFGGRLLNAYNIPGVSSPPGSGVFFSDCASRTTVVLSWVHTALTDAEVQIMRQQWRRDLLGEA